jgi:hypothetical protein
LKEKAMIARIPPAFVATVIALLSTATLADEEMVVTGQTSSRLSSIDQQATNACATAFAATIHAASPAQVRATIGNYSQVVSNLDAMDRETSKVMQVDMNAVLERAGALLAKSVCTVSDNATVLNLVID